MQFLMKLSEHYAAIKGNILMMNLLPTLSQAYRLLIQEERHRELSSMHIVNQGSNDSMVFASTRKFNDRLLNKGVAAAVQQTEIVSNELAEGHIDQVNSPIITLENYNHLLELQGKQNTEFVANQALNIDVDAQANLAGSFSGFNVGLYYIEEQKFATSSELSR
uniref:Uncharacterized protein n=1 Tax=Chenopodium quinoa TaxID=63459 RepID=A0A803M7T8_CHEQI